MNTEGYIRAMKTIVYKYLRAEAAIQQACQWGNYVYIADQTGISVIRATRWRHKSINNSGGSATCCVIALDKRDGTCTLHPREKRVERDQPSFGYRS